MLKRYLKNILDTSRRGDATEPSYYHVLKELLDEYAASAGKKQVHVTTLPKQTEAGNPDFRVWDGKLHIMGYIEAKAPTVEDLGRVEKTGQLKRYRRTFPNLILTNFFEFRLYRSGELIDKVQIGRPYVLTELRHLPPLENEKAFFGLLERFFLFSLPRVDTAKNLAIELARRTRFLRDEVISQELAQEEKTSKDIHGFYEAFRKYLIHGLSREDFADLYSQTIAYGLFAARTRSKNGFDRKLAYDMIPQTIGILRDVFKFISLGELPPQMEWIIDDISEVLAVTDVKNILDQYYREHKGQDPIVHFYETFLAEYAPATRKSRGVYYTPEPVVSYIVRSINIILKEKFGMDEGFASGKVTVLDPAAGTLTFIAEAIKLAVKESDKGVGAGGKEVFIRDHILNKNKNGEDDVLANNFYAFELMMAPYAIGHLKISFLLEELGYRLQPDDRFMLFLTNTLEMEELEQTDLPGVASLCEESRNAGRVKKEKPILVILGNPPYSGHSANRSKTTDKVKQGDQYITHYVLKESDGLKRWAPNLEKADRDRDITRKTWIGQLIEDYKICNNEPLGEKNPKWLQDDYVKFIRFAQSRIDNNGEGVLGFITNHGYLDNPTFRGMRQSLMNTFNKIYILDLHGNSLKKEKCPDGSKDENVFDIQQGVSIALFIKEKDGKGCSVFHSERWGLREKKYEWLLGNDIKTVKWKALSPKSEFYLFVPRDERLLGQYESYLKVTDIFPFNGVGMTTARDKFVIDMDKRKLLNRIRLFKNSKDSDDDLHKAFEINRKKGWSIRKAWNLLQEIPDSKLEKYIAPVHYRPFDIQWIFYHDSIVWRTVKRVMRHMMRENLALITSRLTKGETFKHAQVTTNIVEVICMSPKTSNNGFVFPLYLYPGADKKDLFNHAEEPGAREPNISPEVFVALKEAYGKEPSPEEIFHYIYAVLYCNVYRERYTEFLRIDFPRVPFTRDYNLFMKMGRLGRELVGLHLLESKALGPPVAKFQGEGNGKVETLRYDEGQNRLYINRGQYFEGIAPDVREYHVGGYRVAEKWLKDRKGRLLSLEDIRHYSKVVTALKKTIGLQLAIDRIYPEIEKETI